ncbi:MAG: HupE/UreJ family protein [Cyanobium sp.]
MPAPFRTLAVGGSAGLALSLLSALPASAHNLSGSGWMEGAIHPLTGVDHLLLLVGLGALSARSDRRLLLPALIGAVIGASVGAAGGSIPGAEALAALSVSALGVLLFICRRSANGTAPQMLMGSLVGGAMAVHALLHGREAGGDAGWWIGAALAAGSVVALSHLTFHHASPRTSRMLALLLGVAGLALAIVPIG